eukprot:gene16462-biopygen8251
MSAGAVPQFWQVTPSSAALRPGKNACGAQRSRVRSAWHREFSKTPCPGPRASASAREKWHCLRPVRVRSFDFYRAARVRSATAFISPIGGII